MKNEEMISLILRHLQYQSEHHYNHAPIGIIASNLLVKGHDYMADPKIDWKAVSNDVEKDYGKDYNGSELVSAELSDYDPLTMEITVMCTYKKADGSTFTSKVSLPYKKDYFK
jgi:hypothetical protein